MSLDGKCNQTYSAWPGGLVLSGSGTRTLEAIAFPSLSEAIAHLESNGLIDLPSQQEINQGITEAWNLHNTD